jgi:hypothetical protein
MNSGDAHVVESKPTWTYVKDSQHRNVCCDCNTLCG